MSLSASNCSTPNSSDSLASNGLEDIEYLLYLEALKRFKEDEANIRRQVEEKSRQYQEIKAEYNQLYSKYVSLIKLATTRAALRQNTFLDDSQTETTKDDIAKILQRICANASDYLNPNELAQCTEKLRCFKNHAKLQQIQQELAENKASVKAIQYAIESIQSAVETATMQDLDYFVNDLVITDFNKMDGD